MMRDDEVDDKKSTRLHRRLSDQDEVMLCASASSRWLKSPPEDGKKRGRRRQGRR
jgi:hypothetical protein